MTRSVQARSYADRQELRVEHEDPTSRGEIRAYLENQLSKYAPNSITVEVGMTGDVVRLRANTDTHDQMAACSALVMSDKAVIEDRWDWGGGSG